MASLLPQDDGWTRIATGSPSTEAIDAGELHVVTAAPVHIQYSKALRRPNVKWGTYYGEVRVADPGLDGVAFRFGFGFALLEFQKVAGVRKVTLGAQEHVIDWRNLHEYRVIIRPGPDDGVRGALHVDEDDSPVFTGADSGFSSIGSEALMQNTNSIPAGFSTEFRVTATRFASRIAALPSVLPP